MRALALVAVVVLLGAGGAPTQVPTGPFDVTSLVDAGEDPGPPPWWDDFAVRFPPEAADPDDFGAQVDFVAAAYADQGRVEQAIKLFADVARRAAGKDERARLRAGYEIARLYEVFLGDTPRALHAYLGCARFPLADPVEARQNRLAASFGCLRVLEAAGRDDVADLYRAFARQLLAASDPYGDLLLPEVYLRLGDTLRHTGQDEDAAQAYREAIATGERLSEAVPPNYRAPVSSARVALRRLETQDLDFSRVPDGELRGSSLGYNAPVAVELGFAGGRLVELEVTEFGDKRPLDAYRILPGRVLEAQSFEVDGVTGATVTSRAVLNAAAGAILDHLNGGPER